MARNWAIVIGINSYSNLQDLQYAKADAGAIRDFCERAGFERIFLFTDDSEPISARPNNIDTRPTYGNLRRFFRALFEEAKLKAGDNLWFFFAGHGIRHENRDYLMLSDSDPEDVGATALSVGYIIERLRRWESDNVMLFLDACRDEGSRDGLGIGEETHQGVITFYSCRPREKAWEIEKLKRGSFTHALLEALENPIEGNCATVARLDHYLGRRVPRINTDHGKPLQSPYASAEPAHKIHFILLPHYIRPNPQDLAELKMQAWRAESQGKQDEARRLWIRVNLASAGTDEDAIEALSRLPRVQQQPAPTVTPTRGGREGNLPRDTGVSAGKDKGETGTFPRILEIQPPPAPPVTPPLEETEISALKTFSFEVVTVNSKGGVIQREEKSARYFVEDLGNNVALEMVYIPGGTFWMGTEYEEIKRLVKKFRWNHFSREKPRHPVTLEPFYMSKYPITQAQWRAVAALPKIGIDLESSPTRFKGEKRPVESVTWLEAEEFCKRLSKKTGKDYRLPSEARWEYACRAGTTPPFHFGETITGDLANYGANYTYAEELIGVYRAETTEVGKFPPNAFGLHDTHGNVWEWCEDDYHENYQGAPDDGKAWIDNDNCSQNTKILRGGSWLNLPSDCRSAVRYDISPADRNYNCGFRVSRSVTHPTGGSGVIGVILRVFRGGGW
ncbi:SUMF1/EgtB/PvdO family nonheme iron enzyme [Pannus brasiliensis CCIBt3594]|uniref:SUMF1/EgtB/PvdO family nonheme iron enzyme n=1 Tax=Pannus brasiliensis CCIBt3594 TaxID=1427578 RepID=A0AAW9QQ91_9CHRO